MLTVAGLAPVIAGLGVGWWLRRAGVATAESGRFLLLLNLYVCMPALVLRSLAEVDLTREMAVFPIAAAAMVVAGYIAGRVASRRRDRSETAIVMMALMVVNAAFALPFVEAVYGAAGVARLAAFDAVNSLLVLTFVHAIAARSNPGHGGAPRPLLQVLAMPPLYATVVGVGLSLTGTALPSGVDSFAASFAAASPVLIAVGAGVLFRPTRALLGPASRLAATRIAVGALVAVALVLVLGLEGVDAGVLLLLGVAPVGFVTVTFAAKHDLDTELATQALALSIALSCVLSIGLAVI
ncbi:MAG: AEC family transporter [Nocardioides sp.]